MRQKVHTPSEPTEQEKLSHDSLLGAIGSSVPQGSSESLAFLEDCRAFSLKIWEGCVQAFMYMDTGRVPWRSYYPTTWQRLLVLGLELEQNLLPSSPWSLNCCQPWMTELRWNHMTMRQALFFPIKITLVFLKNHINMSYMLVICDFIPQLKESITLI